MRRSIVALLAAVAGIPGLAAGAADVPWPEAVEVYPPLDPELGAPAGSADPGLAQDLAGWGPWAMTAGEQGWCEARARSGLGGCGTSPAPDLLATLQPSLPHAPDPGPAPAPASLGLPATPPEPGGPELGVPAVAAAGSVEPADGPGSVAPSTVDAVAWRLLRAGWDAGLGASQAPAARLSVQPVHVANPLPDPEAELPDAAGAAFAPLGLAVPGVVIHWSTDTGLGEALADAAGGALPAAGTHEAGRPVSASVGAAPSPGASAMVAAPELAAAPSPDARGASAAGAGPAPLSGWAQGGVAARMVLGSSLLLPAWALYRRIREARALEQPHRKLIYDRVVADPGATPADLRAATGLHYTTCLHHLRVLERLGFVELKRIGGQVRCFENHSRYGVVEAKALAATRSATARRLLEVVLVDPGLTPAEAARRLGVGRSTVKHHTDRLVAWGLLEVANEGAHLRLRVAPGAVAAVASAATRPLPAA